MLFCNQMVPLLGTAFNLLSKEVLRHLSVMLTSSSNKHIFLHLGHNQLNA